MAIKVHEYAGIFPELAEAEFRALCDDIKAHGLREPITTFEGKILDGRHRERACRETGVAPRFAEFTGSEAEAIDFVVSLNLVRRHLDASMGAIAAVKAKEFRARIEAEARKRQAEGGRKSGGDRKSTKAKSSEGKNSFTRSPRNPEVQSRDTVGRMFGTNGRYVDMAQKLHDEEPELFEKVGNGEIKLPQANQQAANRRKQAATQAKLIEAESRNGGQPSWEIIAGDCLEIMAWWQADKPRLIFADPPYNIGVKYGTHYDDNRADGEFIAWQERWIRECGKLLADDGSLWVLMGDEFAAECRLALRTAGLSLRSWIIWYESFGVNCTGKFNRTHRHLFYGVKNPKNFVFNPEAVSRASDRLAVYGDKRANPDGKIWDDVWGIDPAIPRIVGTGAERIPGFPTQLPLGLLRPIIGCASDPGDLVLDLFAGSGTTGAAAIELRRRFVGIELSPEFAEQARKRLTIVQAESVPHEV
jgi:adenine-specific DNA-methyltransferase